MAVIGQLVKTSKLMDLEDVDLDETIQLKNGETRNVKVGLSLSDTDSDTIVTFSAEVLGSGMSWGTTPIELAECRGVRTGHSNTPSGDRSPQ